MTKVKKKAAEYQKAVERVAKMARLRNQLEGFTIRSKQSSELSGSRSNSPVEKEQACLYLTAQNTTKQADQLNYQPNDSFQQLCHSRSVAQSKDCLHLPSLNIIKLAAKRPSEYPTSNRVSKELARGSYDIQT